jgi:ferredoxin-nitrite reductase
VHPQRQKGLNWVGVVLPVGKITSEQMRGIAKISQDFGDGDIRLTVWQNLLISGVASEHIALVESAIETLVLSAKATSIRAGLVACTGSKGCRFAASDTKGHAEAIAAHCEAHVALDVPINIHLTGCHHSCAQHYIGDIGLIGARVETGTEGETVDGYHILVGGGFGPDAAIAREIYRDVKAEDAPQVVETMLRGYLAKRVSHEESFLAFARRNEIEALRQAFEREAAE